MNIKTPYVVSLLLVAGCSGSPPKQNEIPDYAYGESAKENLKRRLRDPDSAVFSDVYLSKKAGAPVACGKVNANNGFGGKTGPQRFIAGGVVATESDMTPSEFGKSWAMLC